MYWHWPSKQSGEGRDIPGLFSFLETTMKNPSADAVFKPKPSKQETKADMTTRIARQILDAETTWRDTKTGKLRQARMAKEATEPTIVPKKSKAKSGART
jgi:hypothetical protein